MADDSPPQAPARRVVGSAHDHPTAGGALATTQPGAPVTPTEATLAPTEDDHDVKVSLRPIGYEFGALIGRGGMGEVVAAQDQRIGREVAIKRMRSARPDRQQLARFLREARIQARLDHPAIVPVYELATDEAGRPYFTMKRVSGRTLAERLTDGAAPQLLLRAFVDVCLAVEFAHSRGVVHRDLKPANIMLGEFGEVYVLDWGVARVMSEAHRLQTDPDIGTLEDGTQTGAMLGTPGYMAPEQIKGIPASYPADVYALGSILFEILAREPLHPRGQGAIASTLTAPQDSPTRRSSDGSVPPELDAIAHGALAEDPEVRMTARELADRVQAYLDGDRDLERRRQLAFEQYAAAGRVLASAGPEARATAMRHAGRALALDPESIAAAELVTKLILEPPAVLPPALVESLALDERKAASLRSRVAVYGFAVVFGLWGALPFLVVKNWSWVIVISIAMVAMALFAYRASRIGYYNMVLGLILPTVFVTLWTRVAGPYMLTPVVICGALLALTANRWMVTRTWAVVAWIIVTTMASNILEWIGVFEPTWHVTATSIETWSTLISVSGVLGQWCLLLANMVLVLIVGIVAVHIHRDARETHRQMHIQAWHLLQLLPPATRDSGRIGGDHVTI